MKNGKTKTFLLRTIAMMSQVGIDPVRMFLFFRELPKYVLDLLKFRSKYKGVMEFSPCLHDWNEEGGATKGEYFWQDFEVARRIFEANPKKHVDIGSRIDGFVAHVAVFRKVEVFDIRLITNEIPGVTFRQVDFMEPLSGMKNYCDSLSCLHALEHFGLGRYGDPIDPDGWKKGLSNLAILLRKKGALYLSVPIGQERVEFNANRVLDPKKVVALAAENSLSLKYMSIFDQGKLEKPLNVDEALLADLANRRYALGIFIFEKRA